MKYLNARPLIRGWLGEVLLDHPAALCAQLAGGHLDLALVSSFEFLRNPIYRIVDDISIASAGAVYSVFVAHLGEISAIDEIELDPTAETSVNLLRCLLAQRGLNPQFVRTPTAPISRSRARLLIGDQAIHFRQEHENDFIFWDLGEEWARLVDLPFVYALWLVRPEVPNAREIADQLRALRDANMANIGDWIKQERNPDFWARYYREHLRFDFGANEKEGLRAFQRLCETHGLLRKRAVELVVV